jgi:hypothetical protein
MPYKLLIWFNIGIINNNKHDHDLHHALTRLIRTREVPGSIPGQRPAFLIGDILSFPQSIQVNTEEMY